MDRLSALDASFLAMDGPTSVGHICLMALLEEDLPRAELRATVERHIHLVPILRRRLRTTPLGIDRPYWVDDPDFDLSHHLIEVTLSRDAGDAELSDLVAGIAATKLERDRPLWELHLIHIPSTGSAAVVTKLHHAAFDGVGGRELLTTLLVNRDQPARDRAPQGAVPDGAPHHGSDPEDADGDLDLEPTALELGAWDPDPLPGTLEMALRTVVGLIDVPGTVLRLEGKLMEQLPRFAITRASRISNQTIEWLTGSAPADDQTAPEVSTPRVSAPATPFNKSITADRSWAFAAVEIAASKAIRTEVGATVNDVVLAMTAGALRRWLLERDALPDEPLRAMVPISVRAPEDTDTGNKIGLMICPLPTGEPDPVTRLREVERATAVAKAHHAMSANTLQDLTRFAVPALATRAARVIARSRVADRLRLPFNLVVSNVPGPREPIELVGRRLGGMYPMATITDALGVNVTVQGYRGRLHVGVVACPALIPDVWGLLDLLLDAHEELVQAAH